MSITAPYLMRASKLAIGHAFQVGRPLNDAERTAFLQTLRTLNELDRLSVMYGTLARSELRQQEPAEHPRGRMLRVELEQLTKRER